MNNVIVLILMGVAGVLAHCLCKLINLNKIAQTGGVEFDWWNGYVKSDKFNIILSFLSIAVWYVVYNEAEGVYSKLSAWKATSFFLVGFFGSYAIQYGKSPGEKRIRNVIDLKTNLSDSITGGSGTAKETIDKAADKGITIEATPKKP